MQDIIFYLNEKDYERIESQENYALSTDLQALSSIIRNQGNDIIKDELTLKYLENLDITSYSIVDRLNVSYFKLFYSRNDSDTYKYIYDTYVLSKSDNDGFKRLSLLLFLELYSRDSNLNSTSFNKYLKEYSLLAETANHKALKISYETLYTGRSVYATEKEYSLLCLQNKELLNTVARELSEPVKASLHENLSDYYRVQRKADKSQQFAFLITKLDDKPYYNTHKFNAYLNLATLALGEKNTVSVNKYIALAENYINPSLQKKQRSTLLKFKSYYIHRPLKEYDSAYTYLNESVNLLNEMSYRTNSLKISELNVELNTAETERNNLILESEKKRNFYIALGLTGILLVGILVAVLATLNFKRKQRIAQQEKELQAQKTATLLKEQEINAINAMVEGQEKERLRLARDLHDNLGGTLAAIKMHVGNLQNNLTSSHHPEELLDKMNVLISDAYASVRGIAHERNSGVMAKEGLLPALENLALKVSSSAGIQIDVEAFGMDNRLSNHLEITIFRIIQELVTNVIKHSGATECVISLTQHQKELNIMVEDNGKGFIAGKLQEKDGMGLGSIERRIEHLEGTMAVDSTLTIGTNIIIDLPLTQTKIYD